LNDLTNVSDADLNSEEAAFEQIEQSLFELKQFFITKPILYKTYQAKMKRLDQLIAFAEQWNWEMEQDGDMLHLPVFHPTEPILTQYQAYFNAKNGFKQQVSHTSSPRVIKQIALLLIELERAFCALFPPFDWCNEDVVFGVDPDPMLLQNVFQTASEEGLKTVAQIHARKEALSKPAILALKRLSLLSKYVYE
jgi:hypothetical protein